ncbi:MAG: hypothetical protein C0467_32375 [Planctomycetaceae bacterium]|nr:hypothetical protein [Planctomycetaceae bacterium]
MTLPSPSDQSLSFALSPDGDGYLASCGQGDGATSLVRLWLTRRLVETTVFEAADLKIDMTPDGTVMVFADCDGRHTIARASLEALIAAMLDVIDRNEDIPQLEALEGQLERSLDAIRNTGRLQGAT